MSSSSSTLALYPIGSSVRMGASGLGATVIGALSDGTILARADHSGRDIFALDARTHAPIVTGIRADLARLRTWDGPDWAVLLEADGESLTVGVWASLEHLGHATAYQAAVHALATTRTASIDLGDGVTLTARIVRA